MLESDFAASINPVREYFETLPPFSGDPIGALCATITLAGDPNLKEQQDRMFRLMLTKWLVGAAANVFITGTDLPAGLDDRAAPVALFHVEQGAVRRVADT